MGRSVREFADDERFSTSLDRNSDVAKGAEPERAVVVQSDVRLISVRGTVKSAVAEVGSVSFASRLAHFESWLVALGAQELDFGSGLDVSVELAYEIEETGSEGL